MAKYRYEVWVLSDEDRWEMYKQCKTLKEAAIFCGSTPSRIRYNHPTGIPSKLSRVSHFEKKGRCFQLLKIPVT